jgi:uncharacterized heparinase superfamily protein
MPAKLATYYNTVRHLKPVQVYSRVWRSLPRRSQSLAAPPPLRPRPARFGARVGNTGWLESLARHARRTGPFRFRFLNAEYEPCGWNDPKLPRLWLYNLHYFEVPEADLMQVWITENPVGEGTGWEPYPTSVRMVNWTKWMLGGGEDAPFRASLAQQTRHLRRRLEYHLLANHLLANAKALTFAGVFFAGAEAEEWRRTGLEILRREIPEQVLDDGAHFERSPMYHSLVLEDLLDLINLANTYPDTIPADSAAIWREAAGRMRGHLDRMCHPDGQISFFNDAAFGIAPLPSDLHRYADSLGVEPLVKASSSGYYRLEAGDTVCLFDAAPIGPDYQPGHSHADTLSFELSHRGHRVLVNSGTSTYEYNQQRRWERSTAAHNTIQVDDLDQSEMWSTFRCARRARPFRVRVDQTPQYAHAEAAHDGYARLANPVIHHRSLNLTTGMLEIEDRLEGTGFHHGEISFYLHPEASTHRLAIIDLDPKFRRRVECAEWHPEFGASVPNMRIIGEWSGYCPITFKTRVVLQA